MIHDKKSRETIEISRLITVKWDKIDLLSNKFNVLSCA